MYYHDLVKVLYRTDYNHSDQEDHEGSGSEPQVIRAQPDGSVTIKSRVQYNFDNKRQNTLNHWRANSKHFHSQTLTKPRHGLVNNMCFRVRELQEISSAKLWLRSMLPILSRAVY